MGFKINTGQGDGCSPGAYYRAPKDAVVDPENEENLSYWSSSLQISTSELRDAIKRYGVVVRHIRRGLTEEAASKAS